MIKKCRSIITKNAYKSRLIFSNLKKKYSFLVVFRNVFVAVRGFVGITRSFFVTELNYLEFQITDHCNLNFNRCSHFSNIAIENYLNIKQFEEDIFRLSVLFDNIRVIRIMGGEPLLHPEVASFIAITRKAFPYSSIRLVTNGILLSKASDLFWKACYNAEAIIDLSVYPPFRNQVKRLELLCDSHRVVMLQSEIKDNFHSCLNVHGDFDKDQRFNECRNSSQVITLRDGYLYPCWRPPVIHYFNKRFDYNIPVDKGIDIYSSGVSGKDIIGQLGFSMEICKWCLNDPSLHLWGCGEINCLNWFV